MLDFSGFCRSGYRSDFDDFLEFLNRYMDGTDTLVFADEYLFWNVNIPPWSEIYYNSTVLWCVFGVSCFLYIFTTYHNSQKSRYMLWSVIAVQTWLGSLASFPRINSKIKLFSIILTYSLIFFLNLHYSHSISLFLTFPHFS